MKGNALLVLGIAILLLFVVYASGIFATPFWEEDFEVGDIKGAWRVEALVNFKDGTSVSAAIDDTLINQVMYNGKEVESIECYTKLKITEFPTNVISIDYSDFQTVLYVEGMSELSFYPATIETTSIYKNEWYTISYFEISEAFLNQFVGQEVDVIIPNTAYNVKVYFEEEYIDLPNHGSIEFQIDIN